jgi:predicted DNA repair protein MutK
VRFAPWLMKALSVAGTIAMFLVGGSIVAHGLPWTHGVDTQLATHPSRFDAIAHSAVTVGINAGVGLVIGLILWALVFAKIRITRVLQRTAK